jgi:Tfp pilus assembly protein PilO
MLRLNPVTFTMNDNPAQTENGFIAQDVQPLFPDLVQTAADASKTLSLNYTGLIAPMVKAMQELKADNDNLREQLETANDANVAAIDALRQELRDLKAGRGWRRSAAQ